MTSNKNNSTYALVVFNLCLTFIALFYSVENLPPRDARDYLEGSFKGDATYTIQPAELLFSGSEIKYSKNVWDPFWRQEQAEREQVVSPGDREGLFQSLYPFPPLRAGTIWSVAAMNALGFFDFFGSLNTKIDKMMIVNYTFFVLCSGLLVLLVSLNINLHAATLANFVFLGNTALNHTVFSHGGHFLLGFAPFLISMLFLSIGHTLTTLIAGFFLSYALVSSSQALFVAPLFLLLIYKNPKLLSWRSILSGGFGFALPIVYLLLVEQTDFFKANGFHTYFEYLTRYSSDVASLAIFKDIWNVYNPSPMYTDPFFFIFLLPMLLSLGGILWHRRLPGLVSLSEIAIVLTASLCSLILIIIFYIPIPRASFGYTMLLTTLVGWFAYKADMTHHRKNIFSVIFSICLILNFVGSSNNKLHSFAEIRLLGHPPKGEVFFGDSGPKRAFSGWTLANGAEAGVDIGKLCEFSQSLVAKNKNYIAFDKRLLHENYLMPHRVQHKDRMVEESKSELALYQTLFEHKDKIEHFERPNYFWLSHAQSSYFYAFIIRQNIKDYLYAPVFKTVDMTKSHYFVVNSAREYSCNLK